MKYDLRCEGFSPDYFLEEELLLQCRRVVMGTGEDNHVRITVRQVEGRVQARVEVSLRGRRVSVVVWRSDPLSAVEGAVDATVSAVKQSDESTTSLGWGRLSEVTNSLL